MLELELATTTIASEPECVLRRLGVKIRRNVYDTKIVLDGSNTSEE